ncbi:hypothetical protein EXN66_Car000270 [Channa argus]|uniref:Uncharacterized protein n=1 Tax=Channa argus TaxID=215402 RepID=A0A6G1QX85_CHAAH|nr:hypothetical protein EXN66_Car000270 [Channa argus]
MGRTLQITGTVRPSVSLLQKSPSSPVSCHATESERCNVGGHAELYGKILLQRKRRISKLLV